MDTILRVENLAKRWYGWNPLLEDINLSLRRGRIVGLWGPNGSGKSTLLDVIMGRAIPQAGKIYLEGREITDGSEIQRVRAGIRLVPQRPAVFPQFSVRRNLQLGVQGIQINPWWPSVDEIEVADIIEIVGADLPLETLAGLLSYGQKRLLNLAMLLSAAPKVLLVDEPFSGIHPSLAGSIANRLSEYCRKQGVAALIVDHDIDLVSRASDEVFELRSGQLRPFRFGERKNILGLGNGNKTKPQSEKNPILSIESYTSGYGDKTVINVDQFAILPAGIVGITGENGCGKTTLFHSMLGQMPKAGWSNGRLIWQGKETPHLREAHLGGEVAFSPQAAGLFPELRLIENLAILGKYDSSWENVAELLPTLSESPSRYAKYLSGGEAKILSLLMLRTLRPKVFLLDEPFAGVAESLLGKLVSIIQEFAKESAVIIIDHRIKILEELCDDMFEIKDGRLSGCRLVNAI